MPYEPPLSLDDPRAPKYWRDEQSGVLEEPIACFLNNWPLSMAQIGLIRRYVQQWVNSPVWDMNPTMDEEHRVELAQLRESAALIRTLADLRAWTRLALDAGVDPF